MSDAPGLAQVSLKFSPTGPRFAISEDATMPIITVTAELQNVAIDPRQPPPIYTWHAEVTFDGAICPNGAFCRTSHSPMAPVSGTSSRFVIPFRQVRGGALKVSVGVLVGGRTLVATSSGLDIVGKNPSPARIAAYVNPHPDFRRLMRNESRLNQFVPHTHFPNFSLVDMGGVGLCQITPPTADDVWNWKCNVDSGWRLFQEKRRIALAFPDHVRKHELKELADKYNDARALAARPSSLLQGHPSRPSPLLPGPAEHSSSVLTALMPETDRESAIPLRRKPIAVTLPDFTEEQLSRDTLRGFNGYACGLHEYRVQVDANGMLVVDEAADGLTGVARWERVKPEERIKVYDRRGLAPLRRGDPYYVDKVEREATF
jgi:hypothetical protein